jgi:hypothetical protein
MALLAGAAVGEPGHLCPTDLSHPEHPSAEHGRTGGDAGSSADREAHTGAHAYAVAHPDPSHGSIHVAPAGRLDITLHSRAPAVERFADAKEDVWTAFEIALALRKGGCALFDQLQVIVLDTRWSPPRSQVRVLAQLDDLEAWQQERIIDAELIARLQVDSPGD